MGPINPLKFGRDGNDSRSEILKEQQISEISDEATSYAQKRHQKLRARLGGENIQSARYLSFMGEISVSNSTNKTSFMTAITVKKDLKITSEDVATESETKMETTIISDVNTVHEDIKSSSEICTTGSCFIKRKSSAYSVPVSLLTPVDIPKEATMSVNGKILSGPGNVYLPFPYGPESINPAPVPKKIMKLVGQAIKEWNMIEEGDRLLLGLSGGKDSLCLLHVLIALQKRAPVKFEIACATVDPQTESYDPSPMIPYLQRLGITYHYLSEPIVELAKTKLQGDSLCAFCSRFKRGLLYSCCRNFKYNKLVLAQHLDDLAESFLMSALHNGQIRTMKANYAINAGDVRVIRPLIYIREKQTRDFSVASKLPIINENCPACFEQPKERARIKKLLLQEESMVPNLYYNLKRGFIPLLHERTYQIMNEISAEVETNGKRMNERIKSSKAQGKLEKIHGKLSKARVDSDNDNEDNDDDEKILESDRKRFRRETVEISIDDNDSHKTETIDEEICTNCFEII